MADLSIPFHGIDRIKYVLARCLTAGSSGRRYLALPAVVVIATCVIAISGCSDTNTSQGVELAGRSDWQMLVDMAADDPVALRAVEFPTDLQSHPEAQAESFAIRAVVIGEDDRTHSVFAQLDRFHLGERTIAASAWSFNSVFRATIAVGTSGDSRVSTQEVFERGALGLASSEGAVVAVGSNEIKITAASSDTRPCDAQVSFVSRQLPDHVMRLNSQIRDCPTANSAGTVLNSWEAAALAISGDMSGSSVSGFAWLTHGWGQPPQPGGAVLLDQLRLRLVSADGEASFLNANRTRRRSGRGPVTVLGEWVSAQGERREIDLQWLDTASVISDATGVEYASGLSLSSTAMNLQLDLDPVVPLAEQADALSNRWAGAVRVSGTHGGIGFADLQPLAALDREG